MSGHYAEHLVAAGDFAGLHERSRVNYAISEEACDVRPVLIDRPKALDRDGGAIDVFPSRVDDSPVGHYRRCEVVEVVRRETDYVLTIGVAAVEYRRGRGPAVGERRFAVREKRDPAVRQPAGVQVVGLSLGDLHHIA